MTIDPPFLSSELLAFIIFEARRDIPTLLSCARVSLAFLELVGPLLYEDVEITREDQYTNLFLDRSSPISPQILPYLSLTQIKHLNLLSPPPSHIFLHPSSRLVVQSGQTNGSPPAPPPSVSALHPSPATLLLTTLAISVHPEGMLSFSVVLECFRPQELVFCRAPPRHAQRIRELGAAPRLRRTDGREDRAADYGETLKKWVTEGSLREVTVEGHTLLGIQSPDSWLPSIIHPTILSLDPSVTLTFNFLSDFPSNTWERRDLRALFPLASQLRSSPNPTPVSPTYRLRVCFQVAKTASTAEVVRSVEEARAFLEDARPEEATQHLGLFLRWLEGEKGMCRSVECRAEEYEAVKKGRKAEGSDL